ncbi:MAG: class C sortase [Bariatricus sp.]|nr:class C sortase [Bariatricus sp.]
MKELLRRTIRFIAYMIGFGILLYPAVSDFVNQKNNTVAINNYDEVIQGITEVEEQNMLAEARSYNASLAGNTELSDPLQNQMLDKTYQSILNLDGNGMMAYLEIPKLSVHIPVYHGVSEAVLQVGAGHVQNTSFPIGGESTHAVLSGHRGLPSAKLFTELDKLNEGDIFYITVMRQTLAYQVDQILTVEPTDTKALRITEGEDYVTLVTCTPYAVNTHRLLVRGTRIPYEKAMKVEKEADTEIVLSTYTKALMIGCSVLIIIWVGKKIVERRRRHG